MNTGAVAVEGPGTCCGLQASDVLSAVGGLDEYAQSSLTEKRAWLESARACMVLVVAEMVERLKGDLQDYTAVVDELIGRVRALVSGRAFPLFPDVVVSVLGEDDTTWLMNLEGLCHGSEPGYIGSVAESMCGGLRGTSRFA